MQLFIETIPASVRTVHIVADPGKAGLKGAQGLARKLQSRGVVNIVADWS
jgi:hypothetical protein